MAIRKINSELAGVQESLNREIINQNFEEQGGALAALGARVEAGAQREFERLLSIGGAVFNGTSDDGPGIQYALDNISADGKFKRIGFPDSGLESAINSANGSMNAAGIFGGIVIPTTVSMDFNGATIKSTGINGSTFLIGVKGKAGSIDPPRGNLKTVIKNADLIAENVSIGGVLYMDGQADTSAAALLTYKNLNMRGSSSQGGLVGYGGNGYLNRFYDCGFSTVSPGAAAFQGPMFGSNAGECFNFTSCVFYNCVAGAGPVIYLNTSSSGIDYNFFGCSFDYNNLRQLVGFAAQFTTMRVSLYGCHIEDAQKSSSPHPMFVIPAGSPNAAINMFGGEIDLFSVGTGTSPSYLMDAGATGASAPNGITLDRVARRIASIPLANAAATGRFVDNA